MEPHSAEGWRLPEWPQCDPNSWNPPQMQALSVPLCGTVVGVGEAGWFPRLGHFLTNFCFSGDPVLHYQPLVLPQACTLRPPRLELPCLPRVCKGRHPFCCVAAFSPHVQSLDQRFCFIARAFYPSHLHLYPCPDINPFLLFGILQDLPSGPWLEYLSVGHAVKKPEFY